MTDKNAGVQAFGITETLVSYATETSYSQLPPDVVDVTKRVILDTLGCIILGSTLAPGAVVSSYISSLGARSGATVVGSTAAPAALAALCNGTSAHADESDASHISWGHPAAITVPAGWALCEENGLSGRDWISAVVVGHDVGTRLIAASGGRQQILRTNHLHSSALFAQGVALASAGLLQLAPDQARFAMAVCGHCISAPAAFLYEARHMTKAFTHGQAAFAGITGALLAARGLEGHDAILEAPHGLFEMWSTPSADFSLATTDLGSDYSVVKTAFKYFPVGYPIQTPLWSALAIMREHSLTSSDIGALRVGMASQAADVVDAPEMAIISLQDMLSLGVVLGRLTHDDVADPDLLGRSDVRSVRDRISIVRDVGLSSDATPSRGSWLELETTGGQSHRIDTQVAPGHWERGGMPWDDVISKFHSLTDSRLGQERSDRIVQFVYDLEAAERLVELGELLTAA